MPTADTVLVVRPPDVAGLDARLTAALEDVTVRTVHDVQGAIDVLDEESVLCVVTSLEVPDENGIEYLRGLEVLDASRERDPDIPVIVVTLTGHEDASRMLIDAGADSHVLRCTGEQALEELTRRTEQLVAKRRAERLAQQTGRINSLLRDVNETLVHADTKEAVEHGICEQLVGDTGHDHAVFCATEEGVDCRAQATSTDVRLDESTLWPLVPPVDTEAIVETDLSDLLGGVEGAAVAYRSLIAIPIRYEHERFGVLVLLDERPDVFDDRRSVYEELGRTIGDAMSAVETRAELARRNERLDEFARMVSHDLRNPLTVAYGHLELARETGAAEHFETVESALDRMDRLVGEMLQQARAAGSEQMRAPSLATVARRAWRQVETGDASLSVSDATLVADPGRLQQLFENLFRNAVEHGSTDTDPDGEQSPLSVSVFPTENGFAVADDGVGIPPDRREDVFEFGFTTAEDGTGYGLGIVSRICVDHDWEITASASDEGGARFDVTGVDIEL